MLSRRTRGRIICRLGNRPTFRDIAHMHSNEEIVARFEAKVRDNPENALFRFSLAKALYDLDRVEEAQEHFKTCLSQRKDWMVVAILLGRCAMQLGEIETAKRHLHHALGLAIAQKHEDPEREVRELLAGLEVL